MSDVQLREELLHIYFQQDVLARQLAETQQRARNAEQNFNTLHDELKEAQQRLAGLEGALELEAEQWIDIRTALGDPKVNDEQIPQLVHLAKVRAETAELDKHQAEARLAEVVAALEAFVAWGKEWQHLTGTALYQKAEAALAKAKGGDVK